MMYVLILIAIGLFMGFRILKNLKQILKPDENSEPDRTRNKSEEQKNK